MAEILNLLDVWKIDEVYQGNKPPELVRINNHEVAVFPFTSKITLVKLHYCDEAEIRSYLRCRGDDCLLCRIGRSVEERALLPVYLPYERKIGVLAISPSSRPGALRPQLMPFLRSDKKVVLLIRKEDQTTYTVGSREINIAMFGCERLLADFENQLEAGEIDLAAVYRSLSNEDLAKVPGIATRMQVKGVTLGVDRQ